jgi:DNA-binding transcriptional LysR family regulator
LEQYLELDHITVSSREPDLDHVDYALNTLSRKRKVKVRVEDYMVASKLVLEADLILTAPRSLAETFGLPITELPFNTPPMEQHMYWHKSMDSDPTNQWLRRVVERCCDRSESGYSNND